MTQRPERVKVGALWFEVIWKDEVWALTTGRAGETSFTDQELRIDADLKPDRLVCVFAHEVFHAVAWVMKSAHDSMPEEDAADAAGYGMTGFWQDNPGALEWWVELVKGPH